MTEEMTPENLAQTIASGLDAEMIGDWDITAKVHGRRPAEVLIWLDSDRNAEGKSFIVRVEEDA